MRFWERSQEENEITFKILNVSEKSQYGQNLHGLNREWVAQILRQPVVMVRLRFKNIKYYGIIYLILIPMVYKGGFSMCRNDIPDERLRVFISSAQSNEGGFAWSEVRHRIKEYLKECPYLNPFIMEDVASTMKSGQFYQRQLLRADIVVLLVKGEVRNGTATEYALATTHKKPMLIYFLEDDTIPELSVVKIKRDVQENDYCTYRSIPDFNNIEKEVRKNVIESVIRYFQDMACQDEYIGVCEETMSLPNELQQSTHGVPTKTAIALFSSCYNHIYDLLGIPQVKGQEDSEQSVLHNLGVTALDWLVTGQGCIADQDILALIDCCASLYLDSEWLNQRWNAIRYEMSGDIDKALMAENQALSLARTSEMPPWIVANILIDCRNIENEILNREQKFFAKGDGQKELDELNTIVYLPVLDRYLGNVYDALVKETEKFKMANPETIFMGTNIGSIINDVENYFFTAILYGSYTHMLIARDLLAKVLCQYDEIVGGEPLLFDSIKLLVLNGNTKTFQKIIGNKWDKAYLSVTSGADELWYLTDRVVSSSKDSMKREVLAKLGLYMTDECFAEAEEYLKNAATSVYWGISEEFFECIYQNISRLNMVCVTKILTEIIREKRFHLGRKLANILLCLRMDGVSNDVQIIFCNVLKEKLSFIVSNGGTPQFIATLVNQNKEVFEVLASVPDNGLDGTEKIFYEINTGSGDWNQVIADKIEIARQQFEANKTPGIYNGFYEKPYATIKNAIREHYTTDMARVINERLIPLCVDVLTSQVPANVKEECIGCLCDTLVYSNRGDVVLTQELVDAIANFDVSETRTIMGRSKGVLVCRVLMLKIITGIADKDEMMEWCFEFTKKDSSTKVALAECVEQYLRYYVQEPMKIDAMILSIVLQCFEDEYWPVRRLACNCLGKLLITRYKERVECKLYEGAIDPSHYVRNHLLRMCKKGEIEVVSVSERIIDILKNDANFAIRTYANN